MELSEKKQSLFDLTRELLDIAWKADKKSPTSVALACLSSVGAMKTYVQSQDTLQRRVRRLGVEEEYTAMRSFLYEALVRICGHPEVDWVRGDNELHRFDLNGTHAYFLKAKNEPEVKNGAYLSNKEAFGRVFRRMFWEKQGGDAVTLLTRKHRWMTFIVPHQWVGEAGAVVGKHDPETLLERLQPFLDRGIGCTLLIAGQPGTGKTSLARRVAGTRGKVLRVTPEAMEHIPAPTFIEIVELTAPDVLLLDDFDRAGSWWTTRFLEQIESLNEQARSTGRLVIATVNSLKSLDSALKRPGRFDMLVVVDLPTATERRAILAHYLEKMGVRGVTHQRLVALGRKTKGMPGAYLELLAERISIYGVEHINREMADIKQHFELCHDFEESKYIHDLLSGALAKQREEGGSESGPSTVEKA